MGERTFLFSRNGYRAHYYGRDWTLLNSWATSRQHSEKCLSLPCSALIVLANMLYSLEFAAIVIALTGCSWPDGVHQYLHFQV